MSIEGRRGRGKIRQVPRGEEVVVEELKLVVDPLHPRVYMGER